MLRLPQGIGAWGDVMRAAPLSNAREDQRATISGVIHSHVRWALPSAIVDDWQ
jgi:hypothetical protein